MKIWALRRFWPSMRKPKLLEMKRKRLISSGNEEQGHSPPTKCETIGKDRISNLPDDVLHTIISLLSTREAVRTSVLSRRWRNMYAYTSNLEFLIGATRNVDYFLATLERFLACHLGSKVVSFKVLCFFPCTYVLQVNDWIDFAIGKGVEDLDLAFTCDNPPKCTGWSGFDYFPAQILLNDEESKLWCPSLRDALVVIHCEGLKGIELNATSLTSFHYKGDEIEFSFEMVPNLEEVYVMMLEINVVPTYAWLEKQLPHVKTLAVVRDWAYSY
ncbi:F-box/LRR-repeat protein 25-like [Pyrus ussuriensis x Pyrus communis]|uniref:F-box/LRR-repeat protein 25-like n=1 Tax=Pyrus ussuriensis x Pyrus communis TaxID=2448454 RepID=A0A5N5GTI4_9ROSA|nr:F-box/LRR-repeat protein 25-like [Pyrus ussuriensis x Pyrus communis]